MSDSITIWKKRTTLSVAEAVLLSCGKLPEQFLNRNRSGPRYRLPTEIDGLYALSELAHEAFREKKLPVREEEGKEWQEGTVSVVDYKAWLQGTGQRSDFFGIGTENEAGHEHPEKESAFLSFIKPGHPFYAPKLAAAIGAWNYVAVMGAKPKRSLKETIAEWLKKNAAEYGLTPSEYAVGQIAQIVNWQPKGGTPAIEDKKLLPFNTSTTAPASPENVATAA
jgi:hypothetical protein